MKYIWILAMLLVLAGCEDKNPSDEVIEKITEIQKTASKKDLTSTLDNPNAEMVEDVLELRDICDKIMGFVGSGNIKSAFEEMKKYTILPESEMDGAYEGTEKQLDLLENRYGKFIGYELVEEQLISDSLVRFVYLARCKNLPLVWRFMFYQSGGKWTMTSFFWDDQIQNLR
jgi:hypothetical protein